MKYFSAGKYTTSISNNILSKLSNVLLAKVVRYVLMAEVIKEVPKGIMILFLMFQYFKLSKVSFIRIEKRPVVEERIR